MFKYAPTQWYISIKLIKKKTRNVPAACMQKFNFLWPEASIFATVAYVLSNTVSMWISRRLFNSELHAYLHSWSTFTTCCICVVRELSESVSKRPVIILFLEDLMPKTNKMWIDFWKRISKFSQGTKSRFTESITSESCQVGIRRETFRSLNKTIWMASYCLIVVLSMASGDSQHVPLSALRLCRGRSVFFFQLQENVATTC